MKRLEYEVAPGLMAVAMPYPPFAEKQDHWWIRFHTQGRALNCFKVIKHAPSRADCITAIKELSAKAVAPL